MTKHYIKSKVLVVLILSGFFSGQSASALTYQQVWDYGHTGQVLGATEYVSNGDFEQLDATGKPVSWTLTTAAFSAVSSTSHSGSHSLQLLNANQVLYADYANSASFTLNPGDYTFSFWLKTQNLINASGTLSGIRGTVAGAYTNVYSGTQDWTFVQKNFTVASAGSYNVSFGSYAEPGGTAWVDQVSVTEATAPAADTTPPVASVTSPANGATVSGSISLIATATDNVGVAGVQFKVDGVNVGAEDTSSPYGSTWDTTTATNGTHLITATARDAAGNLGVSSAVSVTVNNQTSTPTPTSTPPVVSGPQCSDGIDNNMDGKIDYPNDPGCSSPNGTEEFSAPTPPIPVNGLVSGGLLYYPVRSLSPNLLLNSGFESLDANSRPVSWGNATWGDPGFSIDSTVSHSGTNSLKLHDANLTPYADSLGQNIAVHKGGSYYIGGWIKLDSMAATSGSGVRICLSSPYGSNLGGGCTSLLKGTSDWQYVELKDIAFSGDTTATFSFSAYGNSDGTAWFDDGIVQEQYKPPVDVFMLYPNYRGYLFDDQSQFLKFDVQVNPPVGTALFDWSVKAVVTDESSHVQILSQNFSSSADFTATLNPAGMVNGHTYLVRFELLNSSGNSVYEFPPYRVVKVAGSARASMPISANENNQILFNGTSKFLIGAYDSGLGYTTSESSWENTLFSATGSRRLGDVPINFYLNYWYGSTPANAIQALVNVLKNHGIRYIQTDNCSGSSGQFGGFPSDTDNSYLSGLAGISDLGGWYVADECTPDLAAGSLDRVRRLNTYKPDGVNLVVENAPASLFYWRDIADLMAMDPYPMYGTEPAGGYPFSMVADWTRAAKSATQDVRPVVAVLQYFKFTSTSRWPIQSEIRNMSYMAIANGANGVMYWSLGAGALAYICDGSDAYHSPSGSTSWCQAKVDEMSYLKAVVQELDSLQPALSSLDRNDLLASNSNSNITTRVKYANGKGYLIASNYANSTTTSTFTWNSVPTLVNVYNESRSLTLTGASFTDAFGPNQAHVYEISTGAVPAPAINSFTAAPASVALGNSATLSWSVSGASSLSLDQGIGAVTGSSKVVTPATTTTYTLTATNASGQATKTVTVTVTPPQAPVISNLVGSNTTATTTQLSWVTDHAANTQVEYGLTAAYGSSTPVTNTSPMTLTHTVTLSNLTPSSTYHFRAKSQDANNLLATTADFTFTTLSLGAASSTVPDTIPTTPTSPLTPPSGGTSPSTNPSSASGGGGGGSPVVVVYIPPVATSTPNSEVNPGILRLVNYNGTFYLIENGRRKGVTSSGLLYSYGFEFKDASAASNADMALPEDSLLLPGDGALVKSKEDPTVWLISGGQRYGFVSESVFKALGFKFSSVLLVTNPELQALPKASNLADSGAAHLPGLDINKNGTIYWIGDDNQLHGYPSLPIYNSWHLDGDFTKVVPANSADLSLPVGAEVSGRSLAF
ncbi:MAG: hypothetical protein KGJ93_01270 [Patescibacteria group bacterium]|nr:hypothetical protein [Patescibacteria group bacterium]